MADPIEALINSYHELNASVVDELSEEPSPLEFMRYVARNRPFVVRSPALEWDAVKNWDAMYLRRAMANEVVNVAVTPFGNADAVVDLGNGSLYFVEPLDTLESFTDFLDYVQYDSKSSGKDDSSRIVKYAQTQNDNLREEYSKLFEDVPNDIAFARIALRQGADAVNMWIGNERSVTAMHKDNYENIYVQIRGQKRFVLLSPVEMPCVHEQLLPRARYKANASLYELRYGLAIESSEDEEMLPVPTWDPDDPETRTTPYSHLAKPLRITLNEGDMLYLPAMWYHKVSQTAGDEEFACSVNYWYDMEYSGAFWAVNNFVRDVANGSAGSPQ